MLCQCVIILDDLFKYVTRTIIHHLDMYFTQYHTNEQIQWSLGKLIRHQGFFFAQVKSN